MCSFSISDFLISDPRREDGQALVEYALILFLVALVCIGALGAIGVQVNNILNAIAGYL